MTGLALLAGAAALVFLSGVFQPQQHTDYALRKQLYDETANTGIIWHAMPVEQAYAAIAHPRTAYRSKFSQASRDEADYLGALFALTDAAVAERVAIQRKLAQGEAVDPAASNYDAILGGILALETPVYLVPVEELIFEAVTAQRGYLDAWRQSGERAYFDPQAPLVRNSHEQLADAAERLVERFAGESQHNVQAIRDHLSALDFL